MAVMAVGKSAVAVLLAAAAFAPLLVTARLSAEVVPSNATAAGEDWCQALKPCNESKAGDADIESIFDFALGLIPKPAGSTDNYEYQDVKPAEAVDWRTALGNWTLRDQGSCGSCYAFAAAGALEALVAIDRQAFQTSELSEAQLVECLPSSSYGCDSRGSCNGCNGGDPTIALEYALNQNGLPSAADYPYGDLVFADTAGVCRRGPVVQANTSFESVQRVPPTTKALKQAVTMQPVIVGVDASDWSTNYLNEQGIYDGSCTADTLNHALLVVGYDKMSTGEEYWILRNQWGTSWGADGYIYLPIGPDDDKTGGACGLLGVKTDFPPVYPSSASGAIPLQVCSLLLLVVSAVMLLVCV